MFFPSVIAKIIPDLRSVTALVAPKGRLACPNPDRWASAIGFCALVKHFA
jgi:hypothetical protein